MAMFERHFSVAQANALLPRLRRLFRDIHALDTRLDPLCRAHGELLARSAEYNVGGRELAEYFVLSVRWRQLVESIFRLGVQVKDLERGLCDFPHLRDSGEEVFLCWHLAEDKVAYWHDLDAGYAGRTPL
ncbi:MAG: DUF2203 domain-containing protein [Armatimonadetes bacterium]|nr:DUF2203 domain-containing protein [Armatimonadota bacterium]